MPLPTRNSESPKEKTAIEHQDQFRQLVEATGALVVGMDTQARIILFNRRCEELTGYTQAEVLGKNIIQLLISEEDRPRLSIRFRNLVQGTAPSSSPQVYWMTKSGEKRLTRWHNTFITDEEGIVKEIFGIGFDLTEEQKEKTQLAESKELYKLLAENVAEGFLIINHQGVISTCNKAATQIFGYSPKEIIGTPIQTYLHPDDKKRVKEIFQEAIVTQTASSKGWTFKGLHKDGSTIIFHIKNSPLMKEGKFQGFQSIIRDITFEKLMEDALRASEEKYRSIVEQSLQGFAILQDQKLIFVNHAVEEILGYSNEELVTMPFKKVQKIIHPEDREEVWTRFRDRLEGKPVTQRYDTRVLRKDGETRWVEFFSSRLEYQGNPAIQVLILDITDRKQAETARQETETKYQTLVEQSLEGIIITKGVPPRIVFANPAVSEILGYTAEELMDFPPDKVVALISPGDREKVVPRIQSLLDNGTPTPREMRIKHKDNSIRWLHVFGHKIDYEGEPALQFAFLDITDSKLARIALQESEEQYRTLVETSPDAITLTDLEGNVIIANQQTLHIHGFDTVEEIIGKNAFDFIAPEDRPRAYENLEKTLKTGRIDRIEYNLLRADGTRFPGELSASLIRDADGKLRALIGVTRDLSERKEVEARYHSLFDSVPVGIFRTTPDGRILDANPALLEILGYTDLENLVTEKAAEFYVNPIARKQWEELVNQEEVVRGFEAQMRRKDNEIIWVEINARAIKDTNSIVQCYEGTLEDITKRKEAEIKLLSARKRAEFLVDLMAHDLNNINQGIMLSLELLESNENLDDETKQQVNAALAQVERSAELIGNVKRFQTLNEIPQTLGVRELVQPLLAASEAVKRAFPLKRLSLTTNIQNKQYQVIADGFLTELFFNLLHNAMKFDRKEIVEIDVHVDYVQKDEFVQVQIMDRGPGVPDSEKHRLLARYLDESEGVRGSGIGLTLVQRIIQRYGGKIWIEDRIKGDFTHGANFIVLFPRGDS